MRKIYHTVNLALAVLLLQFSSCSNEDASLSTGDDTRKVKISLGEIEPEISSDAESRATMKEEILLAREEWDTDYMVEATLKEEPQSAISSRAATTYSGDYYIAALEHEPSSGDPLRKASQRATSPNPVTLKLPVNHFYSLWAFAKTGTLNEIDPEKFGLKQEIYEYSDGDEVFGGYAERAIHINDNPNNPGGALDEYPNGINLEHLNCKLTVEIIYSGITFLSKVSKQPKAKGHVIMTANQTDGSGNTIKGFYTEYRANDENTTDKAYFTRLNDTQYSLCMVPFLANVGENKKSITIEELKLDDVPMSPKTISLEGLAPFKRNVHYRLRVTVKKQ